MSNQDLADAIHTVSLESEFTFDVQEKKQSGRAMMLAPKNEAQIERTNCDSLVVILSRTSSRYLSQPLLLQDKGDPGQNWLFLCLLLKTAHQPASAAVPEAPDVLKTRFF